MRPHILHNGLHRIGDQPSHFFDPERFLGRDPFDELWMTKPDRPLSNIKQEEKAFVLELALPGFKKEEVKVTVENNRLKIVAEKKTQDVKPNVLYQQEFESLPINYSILLSEQINKKEVNAKLEQGLLTIRLPLEKVTQGKVIQAH